MKLSEIKPNPNNPRVIKDDKFKKLVKSIKEFPKMMELRPLVIDKDNVILGGNMRYRAFQELGYEEIPDTWVKKADELTEEEKKRFIISDNIPYGEWNWDDLANEFKVEDLIDWGFDDSELKIDIEPDEKDDIVPETPEEPKSKLGEIYQLGRHRIMCGDATKKEDVEKLMDGKNADMVFTSPPYWVGFEYENESDKKTIIKHIEESAKLMSLFSKKKIVINTGNISSLTTAQKITGKKQPALLIDWWIDALNNNNFLLRHIRIWAKNGGIKPNRKIDKIDMHWEYLGLFTPEDGDAGFIATFWEANKKPEQEIGTPPWAVNGIWNDIQGTARGSNHIASFPVQLPVRYIIMYLEENGMLYEPYLGSGSTLIACEKTNRICYGMEIDPKYVSVILQRWADYTGQDPVREDGVKWSEICKEAKKMTE